MNFNRRIPAGIVAFAFLLTALPVSASVLDSSFTRSEFNLLTGTRTDITFENFGLTVGQATNYSNAAGLTTGGATFVGSQNGSYMLWLGNPAGGSEDFLSGARLRGPDQIGSSYLMVTLPAQVTAFGVDLASGNPNQANFRIELDGVDIGIIIPTLVAPNRTFFGVLTNTPFSQVKLYTTNGTVNTHGLFDNFAYILNGAEPGGGQGGGGQGGGPLPGETPEVATLVAVGTGLLALGWKRRMLTTPA